MSSLIYLDNAATTPLAPEVLATMQSALERLYGNPSSSHSLGIDASSSLVRSRKAIAGFLDCRPEEVVFTGGGSEADNLALFGTAYASRKRSIVVSAIEHPAVLEAANELAARGWNVSVVPVDRQGMVDAAALVDSVGPDTALVSVMAANNEIGTVQPVKDLARAVKRKAPEALFHTDAVQYFGKVPLSLADGVLDLVSIAAHKIHGPKGVGALYARKGVRIRPLVFGGGQEAGQRSGTENVAGIAGFAKAAELMFSALETDSCHLSALVAAIRQALEAGIPGLLVNGHPESRLPNVLSVSLAGLKSQNLVNFLDDEGVIVSAGSACHSTRTRRSHVVEAIGLPPEYATMRISPSRYTRMADAMEAAARIVRVVEKLRS
jgi:cysteine desulfurase